MSRFITTKADFTLRRKHKKGSGATVYEHDYTTITPMPNAFKQEYVIGDSNFKFTTRLGVSGQKKHIRGKYVPNPSGSTEENGAWTLDTIIDSAITSESKIRLKPNYSSITDFACYGSATKLIQGTVNGVILDFPAEMYLSDESISFYGPDDGKAGYSINEMNAVGPSGKILYNEYGIDIQSKNIQEGSVYNPLRYFSLCGASYTLIVGEDEYPFYGYSVSATSSGECFDNKPVDVDKVADVELTFGEFCEESACKTVKISIFRDYTDNIVYYVHDGSLTGAHIRPKKQIVEQYFQDVDDFTFVLLDRLNKPIYTATFETPQATDTGYFYDMVDYTWPSINGGFNPDLSHGYFAYVDALMGIAEFYDEYFADNMWRSLTHEAIKALDWTYTSNSDGEVEEMSKIDTSRIEPITKIYGRQFDDLKRYADGIKRTNTITYNQKSNAPDYVLTDLLENSGWETKTLKITTDKDVCTESLYPGLSTGYTASDASTEFLRRLKLNSQYLFSVKGTRKGLDSILAMFGFTPDEYDIHEFVYVATPGGEYGNFCDSTKNLPESITYEGETYKKPKYPLAQDVETINKYKVNFNINDPYGDYCGIPVAPIGYTVNVKEGGKPKTYDYSYVVPWYSYRKQYDDGLYFQMNGGWGKRDKMKVDLEIAPSISSITSDFLYDETQARIKFANDFDELLQQAMVSPVLNDVFYVTDISKITEEYTFGPGEVTDLDKLSHYFILENVDLNSILGKTTDGYGWRNIKNDEITNNTTSAGTLVLYLESIVDNTTGNNPHIGGGTYDDGASYVESVTDIFKYSLVNKNFIGIDDKTCDEIKKYVFSKEKQEDNRKCWFFSDNHNITYDKTCSPITFLEAEVTDAFCSGTDGDPDGGSIICGVVPKREGKTITDVLTFFDPMRENSAPKIGGDAKSCFDSSEDTCLYDRYTELNAYDPEKDESGVAGEAAANSIINVKNMEICFNMGYFTNSAKTGMTCEQTDYPVDKDFKGKLTDYINDTVIPYLTQMIPSTTILSWTFNEGTCVGRPSDCYTPPVIEDITINGGGIQGNNLTVECEDMGYRTINVHAPEGVEWTATTRNNWITLSNFTQNSFRVTISNNDGDERNGIIEVKPLVAGTANPTTLSVKQLKCVIPNYIEITYDAFPTDSCDEIVRVITVDANVEWTVTKTADWITTAATNNGFKITVAANENGPRTGYVYVSPVEAGACDRKEIVVEQPDCYIETETPSIRFVQKGSIPSTATSITYELLVWPDDTPVKVTYNDETKSSETGTFTITENTGLTNIVHVITAFCVDYPSITAETTVIQEAFAPTISLEGVLPTGLDTLPATATDVTYKVTSNARTIVSYVKPKSPNPRYKEHPAAPGGATDGFAVGANESSENTIIHTISAYCVDYTAYTASTTIEQDKAEPLVQPTIEVTAQNYTLPATTAETIVTITVTDGVYTSYNIASNVQGFNPAVTNIVVSEDGTQATLTLSFPNIGSTPSVKYTITGNGKGNGRSEHLTCTDSIVIEQLRSDWFLPNVDYILFTYEWGEEDGTDLDSYTFIHGAPSTYSEIYQKGVGFGNGNGKTVQSDSSEKYIGADYQHAILKVACDNLQTGGEYVLINIKELKEYLSDWNPPADAKLIIYLMGNWYNKKGVRHEGNISLTAYTGEELIREPVSEGSSVYRYSPVEGTNFVASKSVNSINVFAHGGANGVSSNNQKAAEYYTTMAAFTINLKDGSTALFSDINDIKSLTPGEDMYKYGLDAGFTGNVKIVNKNISTPFVIMNHLNIPNVNTATSRTYQVELDNPELAITTGSSLSSPYTAKLEIRTETLAGEGTSTSDGAGTSVSNVTPTQFTVTTDSPRELRTDYDVTFKAKLTTENWDSKFNSFLTAFDNNKKFYVTFKETN